MKNIKLVLFAFFGLILLSANASAQFNKRQDYIALYRLYNSQNSDHLYTTSCDEKDTVSRNGYAYEGIAGYISARQARRTVPLYRVQLAGGTHFYTTDAAEMNNLTNSNRSNIAEGIVGYLSSDQARNTAPFYRLANDAKHFYTTDEQEKTDFLRNSNGRLEATTGYIWTSGSSSCDYSNSEQDNYPTIYSGMDFSGAAQVLKSDWNVSDDWDGSPNTIGSIRVPRGWYVVIYRRENFRGESYDLSTDGVFDRNNKWRNRVRSIKIYKGNPPR